MDICLKCKVSPGQFSVEYAVRAIRHDGSEFSLFVPVEFVEVHSEPSDQGSVDGLLHVQRIDHNQDLALVRLPREALDGGWFASVNKAQLLSMKDPLPAGS